MTLIRCLAIPFRTFANILYHPGSMAVTRTEAELSIGMTLFCRRAEELKGFSLVFITTYPVKMTVPEVIHRSSITLLRGHSIPFDRFGRIFRDALPVLIAVPEIVLRGSQFLFGGHAIPFDCFLEILGNPVAGFVEITNVVLCHGMTLLGTFAIDPDFLSDALCFRMGKHPEEVE